MQVAVEAEGKPFSAFPYEQQFCNPANGLVPSQADQQTDQKTKSNTPAHAICSGTATRIANPVALLADLTL